MKSLDVFNIQFNGLNLVEASAGTGKTYNITSLYIRALIDLGLSPSDILVLTFTEDATAELKQRIRSRISECIDAFKSGNAQNDPFLQELLKRDPKQSLKQLKSALFTFDESVISTIHGFCQKLLKEFSTELNVQSDFEILTDPSDLIQENIDEFWRKFIRDNSESGVGRKLIDHFVSDKINPDNLAGLLKQVINKPYAILKPALLTETERDVIFNDIKEAYLRIQKMWQTDKAELEEIIFSGSMHGGWYRPGSFKIYFQNFEDWISQSETPLSGFEKLESFGLTKMDKGTNKGYNPEFPEICELIDVFLSKSAEMDKIVSYFKIECIQEVQKKISAQKEKDNVLTFDDILQKVDENLNKDLQNKLSALYPVALVDEFQDTDPIQYSIFKSVFKGSSSSLFMIGDPKQAIYSFRGADLFTYFQATEDVPDERKYSLDHNYRSNREMISSVNEIFESKATPFVGENPKFRTAKYPENKKTPQLKLNGNPCVPFSIVDCEFDGKKEECSDVICEYVSEQISELLNKDFRIDDRLVQPKDIAVLVRKGAEAQAIQSALIAKNIKSSVKARESVFNSRESKDLSILLKAVYDSSNPGLVRAALVTSLAGFNAKDIIDLESNEERWIEIVRIFLQAEENFTEKGLISGFKVLDSFFNIRENLAKKEQPERRLTNLEHILELLSKEEQKTNASIYAMIRYLNKKTKKNSNVTDDELIRLESDSDLVTISTLHSSKGLEYPIVLVPFLWDDFESSGSKGLKFTEYHDNENRLCIDLFKNPDEEIVLQSRRESLADAIRLNYVAFTRAKYACIVPFANYKGIYNSPLLGTICEPGIIFDKSLKSKDKKQLLEKSLSVLNESENVEYLTSRDKLNASIEGEEIKRELNNDFSHGLTVHENKRGDLFDFKRVFSFSSISSNHETDNHKDYDEFEMAVEETISDEIEESVKSKLSFPKGAATGNLLHFIFEDISFSDPSNVDNVVSEKLKQLGFDSDWKEVLIQWILEVLEHPLFDNMRLSDLEESSLLKEMEFYFPATNLSADRIISVIRNDINLAQIKKESISGFMKGFIDLIFRYEGKFYILDYKSNFLGSEPEDYKAEKLQEAIFSSTYDLQYHIYTVALYKFLKQRIPEFEYNEHFGGVIYLFLRGIDSEQSGSGVFFDKPKEGMIKTIAKLMEDALD
ncbi:MAG: exodeoxyribonuclease V subunit beta [Balneola sp.]|nr:exodeoxyribonuclease V subunit beta [Balneola sp.]MBO6650755.1 exodeoxyribonuclease V subunit beta [Balneola sp.]MBO6710668.1 exodeoxyribonuclease V subunit beta [Balneola sp.]MBO6799354.1 exodeoxyribonuclease V subunit beta [Balneola sp.]MBO6869517.1 exodeoxyribonuclease V subunit beta [Balneola sp.]